MRLTHTGVRQLTQLLHNGGARSDDQAIGPQCLDRAVPSAQLLLEIFFVAAKQDSGHQSAAHVARLASM